MNGGLSFAQDLSLENSPDSYLYLFNWLYFVQCLTSVSSIDHLLCLYARFFVSISFNIDEVLVINPSAYVFVFVDLTFIIGTG